MRGAGLVGHDHIHVALNHQSSILLSDIHTRKVESIQHSAFVIDGGLGGIHVLALRRIIGKLPKNPSRKSHSLTIDIKDRKHDSAAKPIKHPSISTDRNSGVRHFFFSKISSM